MASQNEIANWALDMLGAESIDDINGTEERATKLLGAWIPVRDALLRKKWWRFSIQRRILAEDSAAPVWGYVNQFTLDGDVVRVIQVGEFYPDIDLSDLSNSETAAYLLEGDKILTNMAAPLKVRWIVNSIDVGLWDPCFAKVMACDLAERLAPRLTESESIKARIVNDRREALREAVRSNALETPPRTRADGSWMASRFAV